jgi:hypothetical protein
VVTGQYCPGLAARRQHDEAHQPQICYPPGPLDQTDRYATFRAVACGG